MTQEQVDALERDCDRFNAELPELRSFVLPGGSELRSASPRRAHRLTPSRARGARRGWSPRAQPDRARVPEPPLGSSLHPCEGRQRRRRPGGAALEAWELGLAFLASFVAGYIGSMLGLVLGTLRLPFMVLAAGSPLAAAGTNIAISAAAAGAGGLAHARAGRVDWRVVAWTAPPSIAGAIAGALVADDVSEALLYGLIAAVLVWSGIDLALRPIAARPRERLRVGRGSALAFAIGVLGGAVGVILGTCACRRSYAPSASTCAARRARTSWSASCSAARASRRMRPGREWSGACSQQGSSGRFPAAGSGRARPAGCPRTCCGSHSASSSILVGATFAVQAIL